ncbi:hypothetical protein BGX26_012036 [Mortierella sp. AD094]|nr:hypothetical protein BGX26_012036 [Mortierella sp. AD094]
MAWLSWLIYKTRGAFVSVSNRMSEEVQRGDILISMPDERRLANMTEVSGGVSRGSIGPLLNQPENNQSQVYMPPPLTQSEKSQQHTTPAMTPMNPSTNNSFGLGIDICTKNASNHAPTKGENEDAGISSAGPNTDMPNSASSNKSTLDRNRGSLNRSHQNGVSLSGINHISNINAAASNAPARSRSNSIRSNQSTSNINGRLRDHAKVFPMSRSRASSIHEAYSNRGTPLLRSASREFAPGSAYSLHRVNGSFSSVVSTPTTPLSRGEMGYMGAHTIKALQNFPRSVSMGHIAAFNNAMAGPAGASTHASPVIGAGSGMPSGGFEPSGTPISVRSQSMSNFFSSGPLGGYHPQTPAEAEAAEQSMDEHLRAIRRRSVAAEVMNSPGDINSTENPVFATEGAASPAMSSRAGSFRMSFSSPNLSSYRRRSSLGLKSVLNSILPSSARSSSSSSISSSEASSPCSATSPQESDSAYSADGRSSFEAHSKQQQTVSAQELLRAEYGDLYPNRPDTEQTSDSDQASVNGARNLAAPGASRPRSASVSSDSTTKTTSSAHSDSTSSTISNMTSLSSEERRAARAAGPPRAFLNRLKIGHQRKGSQQQQQKHAQGKGSNGSINEITVMIPAQSHRSENSTPVSKKFPSNGDLGQFSWDYRREMPID